MRGRIVVFFNQPQRPDSALGSNLHRRRELERRCPSSSLHPRTVDAPTRRRRRRPRCSLLPRQPLREAVVARRVKAVDDLADGGICSSHSATHARTQTVPVVCGRSPSFVPHVGGVPQGRRSRSARRNALSRSIVAHAADSPISRDSGTPSHPAAICTSLAIHGHRPGHALRGHGCGVESPRLGQPALCVFFCLGKFCANVRCDLLAGRFHARNVLAHCCA